MNTLADICADQSEFGFPQADPAVLLWSHRKNLLLAQITFKFPDIICLQEVDHWTDWFQPRLRELGYDGVWSGGDRHGCVIAWKVDRWSLVSDIVVNRLIPEASQVMMTGRFISTEGLRLNVVTTHLKAKKPFAAIRLQQGTALLERLTEDVPTIVMGDFNASPDEPIIKLFSSRFTSVYDLDGYTTAKVRSSLTCHMIDYIWISGLQTVSRLSIPPIETLAPEYLPRMDYPSDHLALMAKLSYN